MRLSDLPQMIADAADAPGLREQLAESAARVAALEVQGAQLMMDLQIERDTSNLYYQAFVAMERRTHGK